MRSYGAIVAAGLTSVLAAAAVAAPIPATLRNAISEARQATARSEQYEREARAATDEAVRARAEAEALAARIQAAEADITAAQARTSLAAAMLREQRDRLAARQGPLIRLTAALQALSRRPPALALVQPGSLDDAVRVRAVLAAALPRIRARTADLRREIDRSNALLGQERQARQALLASQTDLAGRRAALAQFEQRQRGRSEDFADLALRESDRALAFGEEARAIERLVSDEGAQAERGRRLAALPGPVPRPIGGNDPPPRRTPFLLPVTGRLLTGVGELSDAGVHARGLTLAVAPDAPVRAPAHGRVAFAGPFRGYGAVLILDHGSGWSSVVTNLASLAVTRGQSVARGAEVGRAGTAAPQVTPQVTIELRFRGRAIALTTFLTG